MDWTKELLDEINWPPEPDYKEAQAENLKRYNRNVNEQISKAIIGQNKPVDNLEKKKRCKDCQKVIADNYIYCQACATRRRCEELRRFAV